MNGLDPAAGSTAALGSLALPSALRRALAARRRKPLEPGAVPAAVLVPLFLKEGEYHLLFTKRTSNMTHHSGEISFPGGVVEPQDRDREETALRETFEELGIPPEDVEVLGVLDDFRSIHDYLVTPVVGLVEREAPLAVNPREIERVIEVPLAHLFEEGVLTVEHWPPWKEGERPVYFYSYQGDEIWGLTARILKQFLEVVEGLPVNRGDDS